MNRSLEALAIFAICLGGMLAVVRFSAQDRSAASRNVAEGTKSKAVPAKTSGTAAEPPATDECQLAYDAGCGLDRGENLVYAPNRPLLSPREVALRAILSPPIPMMILSVEPVQMTGYDAAYDAAMCPAEASQAELSRAEIEAEYAAAELAAAEQGAASGTFSDVPRDSELVAASPVWHLLSNSLKQVRADVAAKSTHLQQSYVAPFSRAIENRWSQAEWPRTLRYPRAKAESRENLLHRQRAAAESNERVTWDDYLTFTGRSLPVRTNEAAEPRVAEQKRPRNVLWPR